MPDKCDKFKADFIDRKEFELRHSEVLIHLGVLDSEHKINALAILNLEKVMDEKFTSNEVARTKAEETNNVRLDGMNRFREENLSDRATYAKKEYVDLRFDVLRKEADTQRKDNSARNLAIVALIISAVEALAIIISAVR